MSRQERDFSTPITAKLIAELERTEITNTQLARAIGVSERQVTRWRGGQVPRYGSVVRMAAYFGRTPEWFYANDEVPA